VELKWATTSLMQILTTVSCTRSVNRWTTASSGGVWGDLERKLADAHGRPLLWFDVGRAGGVGSTKWPRWFGKAPDTMRAAVLPV